MNGRLVVIGDSLLDRDIDGDVSRLSPDAAVPVVDENSNTPRPGGAALAASLAAGDGYSTTLITALGSDAAGEELASLLTQAGVCLVDAGAGGTTPEKIRIRTDGHPLLRLDRGDRARFGEVNEAARTAVAQADAVLVSDYGRGVTAHPEVRQIVEATVARAPVVWDPHPRGSAPVAGCRMVTPNRAEATSFAPPDRGDLVDHQDDGLAAMEQTAKRLLERWKVAGVVVTMGTSGAMFVDGSAHPLVVPPSVVSRGDPCGAGDRFAVSLTVALACGRLPSESVRLGVDAATAFVDSGGAAAVRFGGRPKPGLRPAQHATELAVLTRARGGTVVATGGCFDLLHAGHVATLQAARDLGDCLIVYLNSDVSVARLKGPGRPINRCEDRAAVLLALGCVDAVVVFDDDTPSAALSDIRPHVWAKGGDYGSERLPEADVLEGWGGRVVILPYLGGRSTTALIETAARR